MRLEKVTECNRTYIAHKNIYCYEKSEAYLNELENRFQLYNNVVKIIDDNKRNQGIFCWKEKEIEVLESSCLESVQWSDAVIVITSDYYREVYKKLCQLDGLVNNVDIVYYVANKETEIEEKYRRFYQDKKLENIIVFRSGPHASSYVKGMDFSDNARALFEYMLKERYNEQYELVWLVKHPEEFSRYSVYKNVYFLSFDWSVSEDEEQCKRYYRALCLAKYIFFTDAYGFARNCREDQIRVQLWHGCGFKTRVNFVRCENRYEYTTVISDLYAKIHADIYGLRDDQVLVTGYAKQDWLFYPIEKRILRDIGIPEASKYIFWLPTFRTTEQKLSQLNEYELESDTGLPILNTYSKLCELNYVLEDKKTVLIIKLHPFQDKEKIRCKDYSNIVLLDNEVLAEHDIQINQLLGWADALISDYSSAAVDYLLLDRPVAFTLDDVEEYKHSRGFVFEPIRDWLPGAEIYDFKDFKEYIEDVIEGRDPAGEKRRSIASKMHDFGDDQSSKRILEALGISV